MKARMTMFILLIATVASVTAQTQRELNQESCEAYNQAEKSRHKTIARIKAKFENDPAFFEKFEAYESAWEAYRQAYLAAVWPAADKQMEYGSVWPMCSCLEATAKINEHVTELTNNWLTTGEEGDVCSGSRGR